MRPIFLATAGAAGIALTACAQGPDSIAPVAFPAAAFAQISCRAAAADRQATADRLAALESRQRGAVAGDAFGVFLIGVPVASLTGGDQAGHIATEKGRLIALDARLAGC